MNRYKITENISHRSPRTCTSTQIHKHSHVKVSSYRFYFRYRQKQKQTEDFLLGFGEGSIDITVTFISTKQLYLLVFRLLLFVKDICLGLQFCITFYSDL
jgi:hypothetical protein